MRVGRTDWAVSCSDFLLQSVVKGIIIRPEVDLFLLCRCIGLQTTSIPRAATIDICAVRLTTYRPLCEDEQAWRGLDP